MRKLNIIQPDDMNALLDTKVHFDHIKVNLGGYSKDQNQHLQRRIIGLYRPCGCTQTSLAIIFSLALIAIYLFAFGTGSHGVWAIGFRALFTIFIIAGVVKLGVRFWAQMQLKELIAWIVENPSVHVPQTTTMTGPHQGL
jgi:hypothetical protein